MVSVIEEKNPERIAITCKVNCECFDPENKCLKKSGVCDNVFYVEIHDIDIEILEDYGLTYDTYFPEAAKLADFIENLSRSIIRLFANVSTGRVEVQLVLRLSKNFTTSQVFEFLRITDTTLIN